MRYFDRDYCSVIGAGGAAIFSRLPPRRRCGGI